MNFPAAKSDHAHILTQYFLNGTLFNCLAVNDIPTAFDLDGHFVTQDTESSLGRKISSTLSAEWLWHCRSCFGLDLLADCGLTAVSATLCQICFLWGSALIGYWRSLLDWSTVFKMTNTGREAIFQTCF